MKSLRWRMLAAIGLVIAFAWTLSIAMFVSYLEYGDATRWHAGLQAFGNGIVNALPSSLRGPESLFTAIVLNTLELVLVGLLTWWGLIAALRPLHSVSEELSRRSPYDTDPVSPTQVPTELRPLIHAFNSLLGRVDKAIQAEREFIADAAHELRTPLAALHVQAEVALAASSMAARDDALRKLIDISNRTHRLAEQLLDIARLDAGLHSKAMAPVDILHLARHVISEFRVHAAERDVTLRLVGEVCEVACDIDEIGTAIRNLVDNAIRHGRQGGEVTLRCGWLDHEGGRQAFLEVGDDGPGVPEDELIAIFERFYRAPGTTTEGSGIGLSLVSGIARLHRASVEAKRITAEAGLQVRIVFPRPED